MTTLDTGRLIDRISALLSPHLGPEAADAVATEVVGDIQSHYIMVSKVEVDAARADLASMDVPGLFSTNATKGPQ